MPFIDAFFDERHFCFDEWLRLFYILLKQAWLDWITA